MSKTFSSLFLGVCLTGVFACGGSEGTAPEASSPQAVNAVKEIEGGGESDPYTPDGGPENYLPEITSIKVVGVSNDMRDGFRVVPAARDADGDGISFRYQWKVNGGEIAGATDEVLEWEEGFKRGDEISVEVVPFDGKDEGHLRIERSFVIPNSPPQIVSQPGTAIEGGKFSYAVTAEDPDGDPVEVTLEGAPKGMVIEPTTGLITWNFTEEAAGDHKFQIVASDPDGAKAVQELVLTIP